MTYPEIKLQALASYPPTTELLRAVGRNIGTATQICNALHLGDNGPRLWRRWVSGEARIPAPHWVMLVVAQYEQDGLL